MNRYVKTQKMRLPALGASLVLLVGLSGCSDWNDNGGQSPTFSIPFAQLAAEAGYPSGANAPGALSRPAASDTQSVVNTILVGAIVIWSRPAGQPYTNSTPISNLGDSLRNDLLNSSNGVTFVHLDQLTGPVDTVEIPLPPPGSHQWQIIAAGLATSPSGLGALLDTNAGHLESINYFGFDPRFLKTLSGGQVVDLADTASPQTPVSVIDLTLQRACLVDEPPKGCAQYDADGNLSLTASVEILNVSAVLANGTTQNLNLKSGGSYPVFVRETPGAGENSPSSARSSDLDGIALANGLSIDNGDVSSLTVEVTHMQSLLESAACRALTSTATVQNLRDNCGVDTFTIAL